MSNPYATLSDLANFVSAKVLTAGSSAQQQAFLDTAAALANDYLRSRFDLPLATHGLQLTRHVCNLAAYDLITWRGYNPDSEADKNWRMRYEDALLWLEAVADGKLTPDGMTGGAATPDVNTNPVSGTPGVAPDGSFTVLTPSPRGW